MLPRRLPLATAALAALLATAALAQSRPVTLPASHPATQAAILPTPHPTLWFPTPTSFELELDAALDRNVEEVRFNDTPFDRVVDTLQALSGCPIHVEWQRIVDAGIGKDAPVSYSATNLAFRYVLEEICESICPERTLEFRVEPGAIVIASAEIGPPITTRIYPVGDLLSLGIEWRQVLDRCPRHGHGPTQGECNKLDPDCTEFPPVHESLGRAITESVRPDRWDVAGGVATLSFYGSSLVVEAAADVQEDVADFLTALRSAAAEVGRLRPHRSKPTSSVATRPADLLGTNRVSHAPHDNRPAAELRIDAALDKPIDEMTVCNSAYLEAMLDILTTHAGVPLRVDWKSIEAAGIDRDKPTLGWFRNTTVREALRRVFRDAGRDEVSLTYQVRPSGVLVGVNTHQVTWRVYAVPDILLRYDASMRTFGWTAPPPGSQPAGAVIVEDRRPAGARCALRELIMTTLTPDMWASSGGGGAITFVGPLMCIRQNYEPGEDNIQVFLDALAASLEADQNGGGR